MKAQTPNSNPLNTTSAAKVLTGRSVQRITSFLLLALFLSACSSKESAALPDIKFEKANWDVTSDGSYTYRKQMVNDLLKNYRWAGVKKDSVIKMLGQPNSIEEGNLLYDYERKPILGGIGTSVEAIVFELNADGTVRLARLNDGGWD